MSTAVVAVRAKFIYDANRQELIEIAWAYSFSLECTAAYCVVKFCQTQPLRPDRRVQTFGGRSSAFAEGE